MHCEREHRHCKRERLKGTSPEWYFRELKIAHRIASDALFTHLGIKQYGQPIILFVLENDYPDGDGPTQRELSYKLGISPSTMTISLKSLERLGCVKRLCDENDMRCKRIGITEKGREVACCFKRAFDTINKAMYEGFTPDERELVGGLQMRMADNLLKLAEDCAPGKEETHD